MHNYPFQLGCTSLTHPNLGLVENVRRRPVEFDLIELTLEYPRNLPLEDDDIDELNRLKDKEGLDYSVHLPLSVRLASTNPRLRQPSIEVVAETYERAERLNPLTYTLHVSPIYPPGGSPLTRLFELDQYANRIEYAKDSLLKLKDHVDPGKIAVENLFTELRDLQGFLNHEGYRRCLDVGHMIKGGKDPLLHFYRNADVIENVHLHGVVGDRDHQQLEPDSDLDLVGLFEVIKEVGYEGPIVLEQFTLDHLDRSLSVIEDAWGKAVV
ncbi:sugar phosphate isomerase/epimerase [Candidatus Bipolaricaulota bacterium]|nr:sugar phosphate isomerase/epimerase [Candidatus Bipolaricaulota bacterium]